MEELWDPPAESPRFRVVLRGYHRRQVDEYIQALRAVRRTGEASPAGEADRRLADLFDSALIRRFDVVLRGYDRREVDRYLQQYDR